MYGLFQLLLDCIIAEYGIWYGDHVCSMNCDALSSVTFYSLEFDFGGEIAELHLGLVLVFHPKFRKVRAKMSFLMKVMMMRRRSLIMKRRSKNILNQLLTLLSKPLQHLRRQKDSFRRRREGKRSLLNWRPF